MQTSAHEISQEELMAYLDGELAPEQAGAAVEHIEHCRECQALAADLQSLSRRLCEWRVEDVDFGLPAGNFEQRAKLVTRKRFSFVRNAWAWGAVAAAVVVAISVIPRTGRHAVGTTRLQEFAQLQALRRDTNELPLSNAPNPAPPRAAPPATTGPMIIRTAELSLTVPELDRIRGEIDRSLGSYHGYIAHLSVISPPDQGRTLNATLKVPAADLDNLLAALKKLGHVDSESQSGEEVTQRVVDLDARLGNARNAEQRLRELLRDRSGKLSDVLAVEEQIDNVRGQIEEMQAERESLSHQIAFASLDLKLAEVYRERLAVDRSSTSTKMRNAAVDGYHIVIDGAIDLILFLLAYGPALLILAGVAYFPGRALWKRRKRLIA